MGSRGLSRKRTFSSCKARRVGDDDYFGRAAERTIYCRWPASSSSPVSSRLGRGIALEALRDLDEQFGGHAQVGLRADRTGVSQICGQRQQARLQVGPVAVPSDQPVGGERMSLIPSSELRRGFFCPPARPWAFCPTSNTRLPRRQAKNPLRYVPSHI